MSRNSQTKRAARAKQRARQRARPGAPGLPLTPPEQFRSEDFPFGAPVDEPSGQWYDGARQAPSASETPAAPRHRVRVTLTQVLRRQLAPDWALHELAGVPFATIIAESTDLLSHELQFAYAGGWQPAELVRLTRIKLDVTCAELVVGLIGADNRQRDPARTDRRWSAQLVDVGVPLLVGVDSWLDGWVRGRAAGDPVDLGPVMRLIAHMGSLPDLEVILPPPPGIIPRRPLTGLRAEASGDPVLQRVRALLAKAESTDHEAEATTFTAKAQQLMTKHAIDLALLEGTSPDRSAPGIVRLGVDPPYADAKALLLQTVSDQSRCRALHHSNVLMSSVVGFPTDLEAVELLFTSLLVQAQHALADATAAAPAGARRRSQGFKSAFLIGFTNRIGERLAEANRLAYTDERAATFLPVLRSQEERIADFMEQEFGTMTQGRVRGGYDPAGYHHGELAGDAAHLAAGTVER